MSDEPWYGVRLIYRHSGFSEPAFEERILIVRADSFDGAISKAEQIAGASTSETCEYLDYAMAFQIFDENGPCLGEGVEVFSLIRTSDLSPEEYLSRFHDTGNERTQTI